MRVRHEVLEAIVRHATADAPLECCGLLLGDGELILRSWPAANLRKSAVTFLVNPSDHFAAIRAARREELSVVGAYHSHPRTAPVPSSTDIGEARDPGLVHVIVSLANTSPAVAAYRIADGNFAEIPLVPVP